MSEISDMVQQELLSWPGVTMHDHRFGGVEFRVNGREMGHMHGDILADLPFPKDVSKKLIEERMAAPHHILPESWWISCYVNGIEDVHNVIELFRMRYELLTSYSRKKEERDHRSLTLQSKQ